MKRCEFCGKDLPVHANFCFSCGRSLAERTLSMQGLAQSGGQAPMVPGTPQVGGVPRVPGNTPSPAPNRPQGTGTSAPPQASTLAQQSRRKQPLYHFEPPVHHPIYLPQPTPPQPTPEPEHHHHLWPLHGLTAAATSKGRGGIATRWFIVALAAVAVVITSGFLLAHALIPTTSLDLTFTGSSVVSAGGI